MLQWLARRNQTSVDDVLTRELEDMVCAYADEIASDVDGFEMAMSWPEKTTSEGLTNSAASRSSSSPR